MGDAFRGVKPLLPAISIAERLILRCEPLNNS